MLTIPKNKFNILRSSKTFARAVFSCLLLCISIQSICQKSTDWQLDKMPADLEKDYALSALPSHLRSDATVYLLDPQTGYYIARKGSNGFICFVSRTEWEWGEFEKDIATAISYDAEGARTIFPVYQDVAAMRASGKYSASQIKDTVLERIRRGIYKAPATPGISYMLAPVMRSYPGKPDSKNVMTMSMPHYMFYAPYLTNTDIGGSAEEWPLLINPGAMLLGERKGPFGYIILPAGETEAAKIINENKDLLKRLSAYKPYFAIDSSSPAQSTEKEEAVKAYYSGFEKHDWNEVVSQFADGFTFTSPNNDDHISVEKFKEKCWGTNTFFKKVNFIKMTESDNYLFLMVEIITTDNKVVHNVDVYTFRSGKIKSIEVFFGLGKGYPGNTK